MLSLLDAAGRVLAEPIHADRNIPPFRRATRDGYAVKAFDVQVVPAHLAVLREIRAGETTVNTSVLATGQAIAIMTGAPVPEGADAVLMIEHSSRDEDRIEITKSVSEGDNIVPVGAEGRKGDLLLPAGTRLDYAAIAVAAVVGRSRVLVHAKPKIAVLSTGDEVVDVDVPPAPNQIRNSNSYSLAAQIRASGADPVMLPIAPDEPGRLRELLTEAFESDLVLIAGGVSMGKYDLVEQELASLKAEFFFTGVKIQPGKPVVFGRIPWDAYNSGAELALSDRSPGGSGMGIPSREDREPHKYFFGLPGNPVSTMVTFEIFAEALVQALAGNGAKPLRFLHAKLKRRIQTKTGLKRFLPAQLSGEFENVEVELTPWQGSGDIASVAKSNCFLVIPPEREKIEAGEWVPVLLR